MERLSLTSESKPPKLKKEFADRASARQEMYAFRRSGIDAFNKRGAEVVITPPQMETVQCLITFGGWVKIMEENQ